MNTTKQVDKNELMKYICCFKIKKKSMLVTMVYVSRSWLCCNHFDIKKNSKKYKQKKEN